MAETLSNQGQWVVPLKFPNLGRETVVKIFSEGKIMKENMFYTQ